MPKKRQSQPVQVWLKNTDCVRLKNAAKFTARSQSDIAREAIIKVLDVLELEQRATELEKQLFDGYSVAAKAVVSCAEEEALKFGKTAIGTAHLLLGLTADSTSNVGQILNRAGVTWRFVRGKLIRTQTPGHSPKQTKLDPTENCLKALIRARILAQRLLDPVIHPEHLLLSLLEDSSEGAYSILQLAGIDYAEVRERVMKSRPKRVSRRTTRTRTKRPGAIARNT